MATRLIWTATALRDIEAVAEYISRDSKIYAAETVEGILLAGERLVLFPESGRVVPDSGRQGLREVAASPYRIIYAFDGAVVTVLTVVHAARNWPPAE